MKREQGFTIVEVIVAILVLTVGLLALVTSAALVTRMIGRGSARRWRRSTPSGGSRCARVRLHVAGGRQRSNDARVRAGGLAHVAVRGHGA